MGYTVAWYSVSMGLYIYRQRNGIKEYVKTGCCRDECYNRYTIIVLIFSLSSGHALFRHLEFIRTQQGSVITCRKAV